MEMAERQDKIASLLIKQQSATVSELSELFNVSPVTIRNDLNQLAQNGQIERTHGGARLAGERIRQEYSFTTRRRIKAKEKQQIGHLAAQHVNSGEAILLDASTTAFAVGQSLKQRNDLYNVTVVTTGIWTALELLGVPHLDIVLTGGHVRTASGSIGGVIAHDVLRRFYFQKAFLGAWGITIEDGLMDSPLTEVDLKRTILSRAQEVIAVADGSKFGRTSLASYAPLDKTTLIITDNSAPASIRTALQAARIDFLLAGD